MTRRNLGDCVSARGLASTTVTPLTDVSRAADDVVPSAVPFSGEVVPSNDVDVSPHGGEVVSPDKKQNPPPVQVEIALSEQGKSVTGVQEDPAATDLVEKPSPAQDEIALSAQGKSVTGVQKDPAATELVEDPSRADTPIPVGLHKVLSPSTDTINMLTSHNDFPTALSSIKEYITERDGDTYIPLHSTIVLKNRRRMLYLSLEFGELTMDGLVDSGAFINAMSWSDYNAIKMKSENCVIK